MSIGAIFFLTIIFLIIAFVAFFQIKKALAKQKYKNVMLQTLIYSTISAVVTCAFAVYYNVFSHYDYIEDIAEYFMTSFMYAFIIALMFITYLSLDRIKKLIANLQLNKKNYTQYTNNLSSSISSIKNKLSQP